MIDKVLIIGGNGNMGRRYQAVLKFLGVQHRVFDSQVRPIEHLDWCNGIIIATPTETHYNVFLDIYFNTLKNPKSLPILCEKPFSTDLIEVENCLKFVLQNDLKFQMVNQYKHLAYPDAPKGCETTYDYYHSGADGIYWDCINIIGLDKTDNISLKNESPIWKCTINGQTIDRSDLDLSYVVMVKEWLQNPKSNVHYMMHAHEKVADLAKSQKS